MRLSVDGSCGETPVFVNRSRTISDVEVSGNPGKLANEAKSGSCGLARGDNLEWRRRVFRSVVLLRSWSRCDCAQWDAVLLRCATSPSTCVCKSCRRISESLWKFSFVGLDLFSTILGSSQSNTSFGCRVQSDAISRLFLLMLV